MLRALSYDVAEAGSGPAALELIRGSRPIGLMLTDIVLPDGMSGGDIAEAARALRPMLPVLYMSGYSEEAVIDQGGPDARAQLLQKPFRKADLARAVRKALEAGAA